MRIFKSYTIRNFKIYRCKIPNTSYISSAKFIRNPLRTLLISADKRDIHLIFLEKIP